MVTPRKSDIFDRTLKNHRAIFYRDIFVCLCWYLPTPIVYMRTVFGPVINSQSLLLLSLAMLLVLALVVNGILEWIRERVLLSATISFIGTLEEKVFNVTFVNPEDGVKEPGI